MKLSFYFQFDNFVYRQTIKILETILKMAADQREKYGLPASQVVGIIDMEGFNLKHYAWRPAGELVVTLLKMYEANYPEILKACYIINGKIYLESYKYF